MKSIPQKKSGSKSSFIDRAALPAPPSFYETELAPARFSRPNRHNWIMTRCPFHASKSGKSFAINLDSGAFRCFGCDAHGGDVISYVMLRDRCDFKRAAQVLGVWREHVSELERAQIEREQAERRRKREEKIAAAQQARRERLELRDQIHTAARIMREASDGLERAQAEDERERWWAVLKLAFDDLRDCETEYMRICGLEDRYE